MEVVYLRQSPDWATMTKDKFFSQSFPHSQSYWATVLQEAWKLIEEWNRCCRVPYFQYRQSLKDITLKNLESFTVVQEDCPADIFIPVDDDDWIAPHAFEVVRKSLRPDTDVVIWNHTILDYKGELCHLDNHRMFTNNFALTASGISKLKSGAAPDNLGSRTYPWSNGRQVPLVFATSPCEPHYDLHRRILRTEFIDGSKVLDGKEFNVVRINDRLSLTNKTLASASVMMEISPSGLNSAIQKLHCRELTGPEWSSEEVHMLNELHRGLLFPML